jgi:phage head maturation protease
MDDLMVGFGDAVKSTPDGRVAGYLVRFGTPRDTDLEGDFFTASTDFGRPTNEGDQFPLRLYYAHGMDNQIGRKAIGDGVVTVKSAGLWYEGQIAESDQYREMIKRLAQEGRLGFSSGAAGHLVIRETTGVGKACRIKAWPLGEASLTPRPAESRNVASLKSIVNTKDDYGMEPGEPEMEEPEAPLTPDTVFVGWDTEAVEMIVGRLTSRMVEAVSEMLEYGKPVSDIDQVLTEYHRILLQVAAMPEASKAFDRPVGRPATITQFERRLRDALSLSRREAATIASKTWSILRDAESDNVSDVTVDGPETKTRPDNTNKRNELFRRLIAQRIAVQTAMEDTR